ncbi:MAG: glycosyltransferase [Candidatus Shapirobacteria bacterium]
MISVIITACEEKESIKKALESFLPQIGSKDEIIVVAPDKETLDTASKASNKVTTVTDKGKGKPAALNLALSKAKGKIVILSDGDVWVSDKSVKYLKEKITDSGMGIVSGRPVSLNDRNTVFGFWAYVLTQVADSIRREKDKKNEYFDVSGYLLAAKRGLLPNLPENVLADDVYLSQKVFCQGLKTAYAPKARVYIKYPTNFKDWFKQKIRSAGGASELAEAQAQPMRSFIKEAKGIKYFLGLPQNGKEWFWLASLFLARAGLWLLIFIKHGILKRKTWPRVESTK